MSGHSTESAPTPTNQKPTSAPENAGKPAKGAEPPAADAFDDDCGDSSGGGRSNQ